MANRRMFSQRIVGDENFLEMPQSTQNLYFHLGIYADDDGFVNPQKVIRMIGANPDDLKVLKTKKFVIPFESGVIVITHWKENNYIQNDRKTPTIYQKELKTLNCIQNVYKLDTQVRLGKVRLGKDNIASDDAELTTNKEIEEKKPNPLNEIISYFYELKGWGGKDKEFYKQNEIVYARFARPAKDLLGLCEGNIDEAKNCLKKVSDWAISRDLEWGIETVFKKWYDIDSLKEKDKKPYYKGDRVFEMAGRKYVLMKNGEKLLFSGKEEEIVYK